MYNTKEFNSNFKNHNVSRLAQLMDNPFKVFSASKISNHVKPLTVVEYTDIFGKKYRIPVRNKTQMREAQLFLAMFKEESASMKEILSEYPVSMGRIEKRFLPELKRIFKKRWNLKGSIVEKLAGY